MFMKNIPMYNQMQNIAKRQVHKVDVTFKRSKANGFKISKQLLVCGN